MPISICLHFFFFFQLQIGEGLKHNLEYTQAAEVVFIPKTVDVLVTELVLSALVSKHLVLFRVTSAK